MVAPFWSHDVLVDCAETVGPTLMWLKYVNLKEKWDDEIFFIFVSLILSRSSDFSKKDS